MTTRPELVAGARWENGVLIVTPPLAPHGEEEIRFDFPVPATSKRVTISDLSYLASHQQLCGLFRDVLSVKEFRRRRAAGEKVFVDLGTPLDLWHGHVLVSVEDYAFLRHNFGIAYLARWTTEESETILDGEACVVTEIWGRKSLRTPGSPDIVRLTR